MFLNIPFPYIYSLWVLIIFISANNNAIIY